MAEGFVGNEAHICLPLEWKHRGAPGTKTARERAAMHLLILMCFQNIRMASSKFLLGAIKNRDSYPSLHATVPKICHQSRWTTASILLQCNMFWPEMVFYASWSWVVCCMWGGPRYPHSLDSEGRALWKLNFALMLHHGGERLVFCEWGNQLVWVQRLFLQFVLLWRWVKD